MVIWYVVDVPFFSQVTNFPFPTPPELEALVAAQRCLQALGALDAKEALTELGKAMAVLPLNPRPSRMILQVPSLFCGWEQRRYGDYLALLLMCFVFTAFMLPTVDRNDC